MGFGGGSATQVVSPVARNDKVCGGMEVRLLRRSANRTEIGSGRSSDLTELWSERAAFPRKGKKLGRKRMRCGVPEAPSGAGRGVSPRIARICTYLSAGFLRDSAGLAGYMCAWRA